MSPSEPAATSARSPDWRGWIALAWVVWFGLLYGKMVVETRGGRFRHLIQAAVRGGPSPPLRGSR